MLNKISYSMVIIGYLLKAACCLTNEMNIYAMEGEKITLTCQSIYIDHWEQLNNQTHIIYCNEFRKYSSPTARFTLTEECNLQIRVLKQDFNDTYRCVIDGKYLHYKDFNIIMQKKLSPDDINCTSDISITESFTTTDQTLNGNHQENTSGITRSEILLCCALVCILFLTMISYARNRHYTTRKFNIIWQQNDNTPTDQRASETENIHLYSTVDDYSVQELLVVGDGRMQGGDNDYESNSSIPSRMDFDIEEDYIHPYNIPVYSFQDKKHDYEKLDHSEEYFASISHDGNDDEKSITNTDILCSSITPKGVQIGHVNIGKSSSSKEDTICKTYTDGLTNIHINGANANTNKINQSSNCEVMNHKHHVFDDISLD